MATPLIRIPQSRGGTMYTFGSFSRDMTRVFNNPDLEMAFSSYALLDLPTFTDQTNSNGNAIDFNKLTGISDSSYTPDQNDANVNWAYTLQGYALNAEELILQDDNFDPNRLQSDAEKLFFKYLAATGAIEFQPADSNQTTQGGMVELPAFANNYNPVVKYVGSIDVENDVSYVGNTYHEIYINVPSNHGSTPTVLFESSQFNTAANKLISDGTLAGRSRDDTHPDPTLDNLGLKAIADDEQNNNLVYNVDSNKTTSLGINFDSDQYTQIVGDNQIQSLFEFGQRGSDFNFNAVLVYYDIYSVSNPDKKATNLAGVMLLDDIRADVGSGFKIPEQVKYKPNELTGLNGNAYSLKLNLKFASSLENVGVATNINDFTTFSMDVFMQTSTSLQNATTELLKANRRYNDLASRLDQLENLVVASEDLSQIRNEIDKLQEQINSSSAGQIASVQTQIEELNLRLSQLVKGEIDSELQLNTNLIQAGSGIKLERNNQDLQIINDNNGYSLPRAYAWDKASQQKGSLLNQTNQLKGTDFKQFAIWSKLQPRANYLSLKNLITASVDKDVPTLNSNLEIIIADLNFKWQQGQSFKFSLPFIDFNSNNLIIRTEVNNDLNTQIANLSSLVNGDLLSFKPLIEIICLDSEVYKFEVEILR